MIPARLGMLYRYNGPRSSIRWARDLKLSPPPRSFAHFYSLSKPKKGLEPCDLTHPKTRIKEGNKFFSTHYNSRNLESRTSNLLESTPGSMNAGLLRQARGMLVLWSKHSSVHGAKMAEAILERLVKEATVNENIRVTATVYNQCMNAWSKSRAENAALRVHDILKRMHSRHDKDPLEAPEPDTVSYNTLLHTWSISDDEQATEKAEELIHLMEEKRRINPKGAVIPNTWSYNLVMLAYANRIGEYGTAKAAEDWLLRLSELCVENGPCPDTCSFNVVLLAWTNSGDEKGPDRALELLKLFIKLSNEGHDVYPDASSFTTVISAFAKRGETTKAQEVLYLTRDVNFPEQTDLTPCFNAVIDSWAKSFAEDAGHMAETLLREAFSYSTEKTGVVVKPNTITFTGCLDAHIKSDNPRALENAEQFLQKMIDDFRSGLWDTGPTTKTFNCILNAWSKSNRENNSERAEYWLRIMTDLAKYESFKCRPNSDSYNFCIDSWSHSKAPNAAVRAVRLLQNMEKSYDEGNLHARPTGFSYRAIIKRLLSTNEKSNALEALRLVKKMIEQAKRGNRDANPDTGTCNSVIMGLVQTHDEEAIKGAWDLVTCMDQSSREGMTIMRPDALSFTSVLGALSRLPSDDAKAAAVELYNLMGERGMKERTFIHLNGAALQIILTTLSTIRKERSALKILSILDQVEEFGNKNTVLDGTCLTAFLEALLHVGTVECTLRARDLLLEMIEKYRVGSSTHLPFRHAFAGVMDAVTKCRHEDSMVYVQEMIKLVNNLPFEGNFHKGPGALFYSIAIDFLAKNDNPKAAQEVLLAWEDKCQLNQDIERPNTIIWNKLLRGYSRSSAPDKVSQARSVLDKMIEGRNRGHGGAMPDLTSYNTMLNVAAFAGPDKDAMQEAFRIAKTTFDEMKQLDHIKPDDISYGSMIKVVARLLKRSDAKRNILKRIFEECYTNEQVGPMVIKEIGRVLSAEEIKEVRDIVRQRRGSPAAIHVSQFS